ncbi:MAG: hypothetical protein JKX76_01905 [Colwellia sp.]|nr:hypothetical protein [Colwellia sp.]
MKYTIEHMLSDKRMSISNLNTMVSPNVIIEMKYFISFFGKLFIDSEPMRDLSMRYNHVLDRQTNVI